MVGFSPAWAPHLRVAVPIGQDQCRGKEEGIRLRDATCAIAVWMDHCFSCRSPAEYVFLCSPC